MSGTLAEPTIECRGRGISRRVKDRISVQVLVRGPGHMIVCVEVQVGDLSTAGQKWERLRGGIHREQRRPRKAQDWSKDFYVHTAINSL